MKVLTGISFDFATGEEEGRLYEDVPAFVGGKRDKFEFYKKEKAMYKTKRITSEAWIVEPVRAWEGPVLSEVYRTQKEAREEMRRRNQQVREERVKKKGGF